MKTCVLIFTTVLLIAGDIRVAAASAADSENMIEKMVGKDGLMSPRKVPDGCADDLNQMALRMAKAAEQDFWVKGKTRDAAARLEQAVTAEPRLYFGYSNLKLHYCWALKQCDRAIALLEQGISSCPKWANHHVDLGGVYSEMGKHTLALAEYMKAQAKGIPESASFYYNLGSTYGRMERFADAIASFRKSIELEPAHFNAHRNLIVTFVMQGKHQNARDQIEALLSLGPDDEMAQWAIGARDRLAPGG